MVSGSELVDVPPWLSQHCVGGHPALDLINTVSHRRNPSLAVDRMDTTDKIAFWCAYQGFLSDQEARMLSRLCGAPSAETRLVRSVAELRSATAEIFDAVASHEEIPSAAFAQVLSMSADDRVVLVNVPDEYRDPSRLAVSEVCTASVAAAMALLVVDAVFRLPKERVRACGRCGWLFCDSSKGGRRRWCSMKACGNREKVSRHRRSRQR
jgi:predicted RNA-binding Zn ribbon-like protein